VLVSLDPARAAVYHDALRADRAAAARAGLRASAFADADTRGRVAAEHALACAWPAAAADGSRPDLDQTSTIHPTLAIAIAR
jgi:hypothetical protein